MTLNEMIAELQKTADRFGGDLEVITDVGTDGYLYEDATSVHISPVIGTRSGDGGWKINIERHTNENPNFIIVSI